MHSPPVQSSRHRTRKVLSRMRPAMGCIVEALRASTCCRRSLSCTVETCGRVIVCASSAGQEVVADDGPAKQMLLPKEGSSINTFPSPAAFRDAVCEM